jgi:hypothetical protein
MSNLLKKNKQDEEDDYLEEVLFRTLRRKFTSR